eukprot:TRINITY_DN34292_c0_g2_i1.p1 TRINITY_DN34292_c0_g2~~TRINITY_DN34292_c0_g2_i1.p1  ORF type:complete len:230 (+),score=74.37 TRINITY_DN34292_c0_g2_i1:89-691(+)
MAAAGDAAALDEVKERKVGAGMAKLREAMSRFTTNVMYGILNADLVKLLEAEASVDDVRPRDELWLPELKMRAAADFTERATSLQEEVLARHNVAEYLVKLDAERYGDTSALPEPLAQHGGGVGALTREDFEAEADRYQQRKMLEMLRRHEADQAALNRKLSHENLKKQQELEAILEQLKKQSSALLLAVGPESLSGAGA